MDELWLSLRPAVLVAHSGEVLALRDGRGAHDGLSAAAIPCPGCGEFAVVLGEVGEDEVLFQVKFFFSGFFRGLKSVRQPPC